MPIPATVGAFAIVPCNDLVAAIPFWERLGFARTGGDGQYAIMTGWDCEVHLTQAGDGPWAVPTEHNPFGVFIRTPRVDEFAALADDLIIRPGGILRHREWGMYECGLAGPNGELIRIGWSSRLMEKAP
ncbi:MAG: glyoxalase [Pseudomonadota bacterium]|nr:glyoxalase [Pseudomonadota bacterium]